MQPSFLFIKQIKKAKFFLHFVLLYLQLSYSKTEHTFIRAWNNSLLYPIIGNISEKLPFTRVCFNNLVYLYLDLHPHQIPFTRVCFNNLVYHALMQFVMQISFTRVCFNNLVYPQIRTCRVSYITNGMRNCLLSFLFSRFPSQVVNQPKFIL